MIKLRILCWKDHPGLSCESKVITMVITSGRGRQEHQSGGCRRNSTHLGGFEDGGKEPQVKEFKQLLEAGKDKETDAPLEPP